MKIPDSLLHSKLREVNVIEEELYWDVTFFFDETKFASVLEEGWKTCILIDNISNIFSSSSRLFQNRELLKKTLKWARILAKDLDSEFTTKIFISALNKGDSKICELGSVKFDHQNNNSFAENLSFPEDIILDPIHLSKSLDLLLANFVFNYKYKGLILIISDGRLSNFNDIREMSRKILSSNSSLKVVFLLIGDDINYGSVEKLEKINDELPNWLWDFKIEKELKKSHPLNQLSPALNLLTKMIDDQIIISKAGNILTPDEDIIESFTDGFPASWRFKLPKAFTEFVIKIPGESVIIQSVIKKTGSV